MKSQSNINKQFKIKQKRNKRSVYDRTQIDVAVDLVLKNKLSLRAASHIYKIPFSTLRTRKICKFEIVFHVQWGVEKILKRREEKKVTCGHGKTYLTFNCSVSIFLSFDTFSTIQSSQSSNHEFTN